ncbi:MAG: hypothetical protein J6X14_01670 [Lachnospiraceae bacterium]|nr:hypothetical protein [Lachnospiraceae bacterium]MBO7340106.1 hypothetical protein [Lachnospiraceae bacterium]MBP5265007.1 hypothetical protein [Lachnospiraceae bacterium]MBP5668996.1 hypothetical protein [Lachnospiraceae bacterium]
MADEKNMQELDEKQLSDVAGGNWGEAERYFSLLFTKHPEAKTREELFNVMTDEERAIYERKMQQ